MNQEAPARPPLLQQMDKAMVSEEEVAQREAVPDQGKNAVSSKVEKVQLDVLGIADPDSSNAQDLTNRTQTDGTYPKCPSKVNRVEEKRRKTTIMPNRRVRRHCGSGENDKGVSPIAAASFSNEEREAVARL